MAWSRVNIHMVTIPPLGSGLDAQMPLQLFYLRLSLDFLHMIIRSISWKSSLLQDSSWLSYPNFCPLVKVASRTRSRLPKFSTVKLKA